MALQERFTIIQGPPGTGKTTVVGTIVANWMRMADCPKILICAPSNTAADNIAETLSRIPSLEGKFIRFTSEKREDIYNIDLSSLQSYQLLHKIIYQNETVQTDLKGQILGLDKRVLALQQNLEHLFSDFKHSIFDTLTADSQGYFELAELLNLKYFNNFSAPTKEKVQESEPLSVNWELDTKKLLIRTKAKVVNEKLTMLGFDKSGIRNLSEQELKKFLKSKKKQENLILSKIPIVVTTCKASSNKRLLKFQFKKVIVDEAAQSQEIEILETLRHAEQVVLIGDHKQLGPIFRCDVKLGTESMLGRLFEAKYIN